MPIPIDIHVIKLGGSLLDLPDLGTRLAAFLRAEGKPRPALLVGGGRAADVVRSFDVRFALSSEAGHWLAVRAMQLNAHCLAAALPGCRIVSAEEECQHAWAASETAVIDPLIWLGREDEAGVTIPHRWTFTSDSIAAHVARRLGARRLTLLKSGLPPGECGPARAAELGVVDEDFPDACVGVARVELVNLRQDPPGRCVLR